jgi:hypothetical protein
MGRGCKNAEMRGKSRMPTNGPIYQFLQKKINAGKRTIINCPGFRLIGKRGVQGD